MKIQDIIDEYDKDSHIDILKLNEESVRIPELHHKYLKIFLEERAKLITMKSKQKRLKYLLSQYFAKTIQDDEFEELGREITPRGKAMKSEAESWAESDKEYMAVSLKVAEQQEKVDYLDAIIRQITNRSFQIKNAIEWMKYKNAEL